MTRGITYWMLVSSLENFRISQELGFTVQGMKKSQRRKAQRMEPSDRVVCYIAGIQKFGGTLTVASKYFEDRKPLWRSEGKAEEYPWRVNTKPDVILEEEEFLDARELGPRMEYVKKWPPEYWPLAFQGNLHILSRKDFELLEEEMKKAIPRKGKVAR